MSAFLVAVGLIFNGSIERKRTMGLTAHEETLGDAHTLPKRTRQRKTEGSIGGREE